jgi:hypothetical protein
VADLSLKERCSRRLAGLKRQRKSFEDDARQIASLALPARSRFLSTDANKGRQPNKRLNNSHGIFAFRTLQGGMTSGLSSQSRPWFSLSVYDDGLMENQEVKEWLGVVEERMYAFLARTNFYGAVKTGYLELGAFGTDACVALDDDDEGMVCHALTFGEYWIGLNKALMPGCLYRDVALTTLQAVEQLGYDNLSARIRASYDQSRYEEIHQFYHAIEENDDFVAHGLLGLKGKPWRSIWWDANDATKDQLVKLSGYEEQPFWAPRWDTTGADTYGQGPGHDSLPDLRELQLQTKRRAEATDLAIWPEIVTTTRIKLRRQPKSVVSTDQLDAQKMIAIPHQVPYQAIQVVDQSIERLEAKVNEATYADLFMAITNMQGIQPRNIEEIAARNEEKLTQLGPVIERVNGEKLEIAITRVFGIMQRKGLLPPAPDVLRHNPQIKIEFVSILTQMQRMVGLGQIERTVQFVGGLTPIFPNARFKLDVNEIVDEYAKRAGMPAKLIRSNEDAQGDADAEAQAAQNAQLAEAAAKLGKPTKDLTDAASVAANLPVAATPPIQDLTAG